MTERIRSFLSQFPLSKQGNTHESHAADESDRGWCVTECHAISLFSPFVFVSMFRVCSRKGVKVYLFFLLSDSVICSPEILDLLRRGRL